MASSPAPRFAEPTFISIGLRRFSALWKATMGQECPPAFEHMFADMLQPWGHAPIPEVPRWRSRIAEDHSPYEFSVAIGGSQPELRVLFEAQAEQPNVLDHWEAARALNDRLERDFVADLTRFHQIEDLFWPHDPEAQFAMWHAVCLFPNRAPEWKLYLNPLARGPQAAFEVVTEALERLGHRHAPRVLSEVAAMRGDQIAYFSLDLSAKTDARVKVYHRHPDITPAELERVFALANGTVPGDVTEFWNAMTAGEEQPFRLKAPQTCLSFNDVTSTRPAAATLYLPVDHCVSDDAEVSARIRRYLAAHDMPVRAYEQPIKAFANRPLDAGAGLHSYAAFRRESRGPRLTFYLAAELYVMENAVAHSFVRSRGPAAESLPVKIMA
jgi:DMATS type aromatic prenyltransferase